MGHGEPVNVPHHSVFKHWQHCPKLVAHQKRLNRIGLSDPWIRNYVWRFNEAGQKHGDNRFYHMWRVSRIGFWPGLAIAAGVITVEETYSFFKHGHTSWGGHH